MALYLAADPLEPSYICEFVNFTTSSIWSNFGGFMQYERVFDTNLRIETNRI